MLDDDSPGLGVDFVIDAGASFAELAQLSAVMQSTEAKILADANRIEQATRGMVDLSGATASIKAFGGAATREAATAARELGRVEKSGEALSRQLERQAAAFGKTREEIRAVKVETAALAAEQKGLTELAGRLRGQEAALSASEAAAIRQVKEEAERAAQAKVLAADAAADAAAREEQRVRSAGFAYDQFNRFAREKMAIHQAQQALDAAAAREVQVARDRATAEAAVNAQLLERSRIQAALERNTGVGRVSATDAGATFSALAAKAAEDEARAQSVLAASTRQAAVEHERLRAAVMGSHAAQLADAEAAERLRMATDPLYAATSRLNTEIAESTRLYLAGATAPAEYARQQQVLTGRLNQAAAAQNLNSAMARRGASSMTQLSFQINDVATMAAMGAAPMQIFVSQIGQIVQVAQMSEGGIKGFGKEVLGLATRFAPLLAVLGVAAGAFALFERAVTAGINTKKIVADLGLTRDEIKKLKDVSVDTGDVVTATFQVMTEMISKDLGISMSQISSGWTSSMDWLTVKARQTLAMLHAMFVGTFSTLAKIAADAMQGKLPDNVFASIGEGVMKEYRKMDGMLQKFGGDVSARIVKNKTADLKKQAAALIADRTPKKDRGDDRAARLAREAEATEAQIRNLYALAAAYRVSGAAALIAEARVKAESQAIKQRAAIEAAVDRQARLSIAQRVSDAAKAAAAVRDQARLQTEINGEVAAGMVPAERAAELLQQRIAELPLLAAQEAAQQRGLKTEVEAATKALDEQRSAQADLDAAAMGARFVAADAAADDRLAELREELRLVGATDEARVRALATLRATREAETMFAGAPANQAAYIAKQVEIAVTTQELARQQAAYNEQLTFSADRWDIIAGKVQSAAAGMADAFGSAGQAIGGVASIFADFHADRERAEVEHAKRVKESGKDQGRLNRENQLFAMRSSGAQIAMYGDMASAAKGFFKEGSAGYKALAMAEKVYRIAQLAMSLQSMLQNTLETGTHVANAAARATADGAAGVAAQAKLPFPANIAAMAATAAALVAAGVAMVGGGGGGGRAAPVTNTGTGTVLGDTDAKSESVRRAIDALKEVDTLMLTSSRSMAASLRSIDSQIGGVAAVIVRGGDINASSRVTEGFKSNFLGSVLGKVPLIGGFLSGLFGSKTDVIGSGLIGGPQSLGSILDGGFSARTYSDVKKTSKFFGISTGTSYSTKYGSAVPELGEQFTLLLRSFNDAIGAAAGPLGLAMADIQARLSGFVVNIGKIDLKGLTGAEIQEKLEAVFGAAADNMAAAAFPGMERFQRVGEGAFETLVRVSSTVEAVTASLDQLGAGARVLGIDAKLGLADQFESVGALTSAIGGYFEAFYTPAEQTAARVAQLTTVFGSLGFVMPDTLAGFRQLVEAQDLTTGAGQATYATLLQLAPAFAELQQALVGTKSAADLASERADLERKLLELQGDTAAIRALDLAKLDASNRGLQQQIWAMQDGQEAARAADELRKAWTSVGDSIADEVKRIRGLTGVAGGGSFMELQGRFNATSNAARGGDQDAAKSLPGLSQALLAAAALAATSRQELDRVQAQTASSLEETLGMVGRFGAAAQPTSTAALLAAAAATQPAAPPAAANDDLVSEVRELRAEIAQLRQDNNAGHAATAGHAGRVARKLDDVTAASGGDAISTVAA